MPHHRQSICIQASAARSGSAAGSAAVGRSASQQQRQSGTRLGSMPSASDADGSRKLSSVNLPRSGAASTAAVAPTAPAAFSTWHGESQPGAQPQPGSPNNRVRLSAAAASTVCVVLSAWRGRQPRAQPLPGSPGSRVRRSAASAAAASAACAPTSPCSSRATARCSCFTASAAHENARAHSNHRPGTLISIRMVLYQPWHRPLQLLYHICGRCEAEH